MNDARFEFEWVDPQGARGQELRATWARLEIWLDARCVTRVLDQEVKAVRDAVYLPLYPIAEWLATHWWSLLAEVPSSDRVADPGYAQRHSLRAAREGFALPHASIASEGDHVRIQWWREALPNYRVEFIEEGIAHVPVDAFRRALTKFITAVVDRLDAEGILRTPLQDEWKALQTLSKEEEEFCEVAAALGLDPLGLDAETENRIINATQSVPPRLQRDFLFAATVDGLVAETNDVGQAYTSAQENEAVLKSIVALRNQMAHAPGQSSVSPWSRGYLAAQHLRKTLKNTTDPLPSFDHIANALRMTNGDLEAALVPMSNATGVYEAVVATNRRQSPAFALSGRHSKAAQRFHFCRGLYEFLHGEDDGPWLVTRSLSDAQKQSRAFAAEFLAPAMALRERVTGQAISVDEVDDIAQVFGVSEWVINHQLENHQIAAVLSS